MANIVHALLASDRCLELETAARSAASTPAINAVGHGSSKMHVPRVSALQTKPLSVRRRLLLHRPRQRSCASTCCSALAGAGAVWSGAASCARIARIGWS